jgi:hypothetical protein
MEKKIGKVTHYFTNLGRITDFTQCVTSMEIEHKKLETVGPGIEVAIKVEDYVRKGDEIFKVSE